MGIVDSPCLGICELDIETDLCIGCLRTRTEVAAWSSATDEVKLEILERVKARSRSSKKGKLE